MKPRRASATVAALRDAHGADLVVMVVGDQTGYAGVAYVQNVDCGIVELYENTPGCDVGQAHSPFAFSAVSIRFATSYQVFAHEIGHQFGMQHQSAPGISPAYPWSYAKTYFSLETVEGGEGRTRSLQYSNPNVT